MYSVAHFQTPEGRGSFEDLGGSPETWQRESKETNTVQEEFPWSRHYETDARKSIDQNLQFFFLIVFAYFLKMDMLRINWL